MKGKKTIFFLILILTSNASIVFGASNEGYGEDSTALGQFVDTFDTDDNISVAVNVVQNSTYEAVILNHTIGTGTLYEDLTTYTEVDSGNDITVIERRVTWSSMQRNAISWVVYDFGVDYFGDFQCNFTLDFSDIEAGDVSNRHIMPIIYFSNTIGTFADTGLGDLLVILPRQVGATDDIYRYDHRQVTGGVQDFVIADTTNYAMVQHWGTFERIGNVIKLRIYTDEARTVITETFSTVGNVKPYRYFHVIGSYDSGADGADHSSGIVANVTFGESASGYAPTGYFITTNYLNDTIVNGTTLALQTISKIPANTAIKVQFSNDNVTWRNNLGTVGLGNTLISGLDSIDMRGLNYTVAYLRYNESTTDSTVTPYLNQSKIITTVGRGSIIVNNITNLYVNGTWEYHNVSSILTIIGVHDSGDVNSTLDVDADSYNSSEVVGAPGYIVGFNFTNVNASASCMWVVAYVYYDGNLAHDVHVELFNQTSLAWVEIDVLDDDVAFEWHNSSIYELRIPSDFINATGSVFGRFNHVANGNINHDIFIEYLKLHVFIPTGLAVSVGGISGGINSASILMLIFLCGLAIILLWRFAK